MLKVMNNRNNNKKERVVINMKNRHIYNIIDITLDILIIISLVIIVSACILNTKEVKEDNINTLEPYTCPLNK